MSVLTAILTPTNYVSLRIHCIAQLDVWSSKFLRYRFRRVIPVGDRRFLYFENESPFDTDHRSHIKDSVEACEACAVVLERCITVKRRKLLQEGSSDDRAIF